MAEITLTAADWAAMAYMNESQVAAYVYALGAGEYTGKDELVQVCFDIAMARTEAACEQGNDRFDRRIETSKANGCKGGRPRKPKKPNENLNNLKNLTEIRFSEGEEKPKSDLVFDTTSESKSVCYEYDENLNNLNEIRFSESESQKHNDSSRACVCGNNYNITSNNSISVIDNNIKHKPNNNSLIEYKKEKEKKSERKENEKAEDKKSRFVPPTIGEIQALIDERGYTNVSAGGFWNFYESKGWMIGKNKMRDWRAALAGWEARDRKKVAQSQEMPRTFTSDGSYYTETL